MLRNILLGALITLSSQGAFAISETKESVERGLRFGGDFGLGVATVSVSGSTRQEGPGTFALNAEYAPSSVYAFGIEHARTLVDDNGPSSGVGFTSLFGKYYFYSARPQIEPKNEVIDIDYILVKEIVPYFGASVGIGQASLRSLNKSQSEGRSLSVGSSVGAKFGVEMNLIDNYILYSEGHAMMTVFGTGSISFIRVAVGLQLAF